MLAYGGGEVDLSGLTGSYRINTVDARSGNVTRGEIIRAGSKVSLPKATLVWLTKEK